MLKIPKIIMTSKKMNTNALVLLAFSLFLQTTLSVYADDVEGDYPPLAEPVPVAAPVATPKETVSASSPACKLFIKRSIERAKLAKRLKCEIKDIDKAYLSEDAASYETFCSTKEGLKGDWMRTVEPSEREIIRALSECVERKVGIAPPGILDATDVKCQSNSSPGSQNPVVVAPHGVKCDGKDNAKAGLCIYQGSCSITSAGLNFEHPFICPIDAVTAKCPDFNTCVAFKKKPEFQVREARLTGLASGFEKQPADEPVSPASTP